MRELPEPDLGFAHKSYSPKLVLAIQKQAYEDGLRDAPKFPEGWKAEFVSDGDIRLYGPRHMFGDHKETWLIQSGLGGGFYGFLHRMLSAMLTASQKEQ